jgi:multidrug efflux pump subunit AcrB
MNTYVLLRDVEMKLEAKQDSASNRILSLLEALSSKIDAVNKDLSSKIDTVNRDMLTLNKDLSSKIDTVNKDLSSKIDKTERKLDALEKDQFTSKTLSFAIIAILAFTQPKLNELFTFLASFFKFR